MTKTVRTISFGLCINTACHKGIKFLYTMSERYPNHTVKMLSNVEEKLDYYFSDAINIDEALCMFKNTTYTSAFIRADQNVCYFNPFSQNIEVVGDDSFYVLCKEVWQETFADNTTTSYFFTNTLHSKSIV